MYLKICKLGVKSSALCFTSLLLLAVLNDSRCVYKGHTFQQLVRHFNTNQLFQEVLAKLLQWRKGARAVCSHNNALNRADLLPMHNYSELRGSRLSS